MIWLRLLPWIGWGTTFVMAGLWLSARDTIAENKAACNADVLSAALAEERLLRLSQAEDYAKQLRDLEQAYVIAKEAIDRAERIAFSASNKRVAVEEALAKLEKEIRDDQNVDKGKACLRERWPNDILDRLRKQRNPCHDTGSCEGNGNEVRLDPSRSDATDTASTDT